MATIIRIYPQLLLEHLYYITSLYGFQGSSVLSHFRSRITGPSLCYRAELDPELDPDKRRHSLDRKINLWCIVISIHRLYGQIDSFVSWQVGPRVGR